MKPAIIIPARYASSRFPGKPLAEIAGKTLIRRVWERCLPVLSVEDIWVATDDGRIADHCRSFGARVVMTSTSCLTGTDRVHEASLQIAADVYINVQGDEPLIDGDDIRHVIAVAEAHPGAIVNAMCAVDLESDFRSPTVPKVVTRPDGRLLYMSRAAIPTDKKLAFRTTMKQVCIYAFDAPALAAFAAAGRRTPLEDIEDIEILRFLELGYEVRMVEVSQAAIAVDVPDDIARVEAALQARRLR
jgi:3-deoxy-manno-octulosonate cytidylyltransferase (CMP-KDO synthetase)